MSNNKLVINELPNNKQELVELNSEQAGDINGGYYYPLPIYYPTLQDFAIANRAAFRMNMLQSDLDVQNFIDNKINY